MKTKEEVLALLLALGNSKEEVAKNLEKRGIKGNRKRCNSCPIAEYLWRNGVREYVRVGIFKVLSLGTVPVASYFFDMHSFPQLKPLEDFIYTFDCGGFPQLEA